MSEIARVFDISRPQSKLKEASASMSREPNKGVVDDYITLVDSDEFSKPPESFAADDHLPLQQSLAETDFKSKNVPLLFGSPIKKAS